MADERFGLLLPLTYNDGSKVPEALLQQIYRALFEEFDGFTVRGTVEGEYRTASGERRVEQSVELWVVANEERRSRLERLVAGFGALLGQESMYLERTHGEVSFIPSAPFEQPS